MKKILTEAEAKAEFEKLKKEHHALIEKRRMAEVELTLASKQLTEARNRYSIADVTVNSSKREESIRNSDADDAYAVLCAIQIAARGEIG